MQRGVLIGIVSSLDDPEHLGRVKVRYPTRGDQESDWVRLVSAGAGKGRGFFSRPEENDQVVVVFEEGDPLKAYALGGVWSEADRPPQGDGKAKDNNWRFLRSRSGHVIKLDDTKDAERIEIVDKDGQRRVVLDAAKKKIQVICDQGDVEVTAKAGSVKVEAATIEIKATGNLTLDAKGALTLKGATVDIN
jgi:phage baseplate assembly protein V